MKKPTLFLVLALLTFLAGAEDAVSIPKVARRCFVIIESADEKGTDPSPARVEIGRMGKEAEDMAALEAGLKTLGEVRVVRFQAYSVLFVKLGHGNTKALDQEIQIDFFTGSPVGLLQRIRKESGTHWTKLLMMLIPSDDMYAVDSLTRVTVKDFRGSIRQILAETIPPSY